MAVSFGLISLILRDFWIALASHRAWL